MDRKRYEELKGLFEAELDTGSYKKYRRFLPEEDLLQECFVEFIQLPADALLELRVKDAVRTACVRIRKDHQRQIRGYRSDIIEQPVEDVNRLTGRIIK